MQLFLWILTDNGIYDSQSNKLHQTLNYSIHECDLMFAQLFLRQEKNLHNKQNIVTAASPRQFLKIFCFYLAITVILIGHNIHDKELHFHKAQNPENFQLDLVLVKQDFQTKKKMFLKKLVKKQTNNCPSKRHLCRFAAFLATPFRCCCRQRAAAKSTLIRGSRPSLKINLHKNYKKNCLKNDILKILQIQKYYCSLV